VLVHIEWEWNVSRTLNTIKPSLLRVDPRLSELRDDLLGIIDRRGLFVHELISISHSKGREGAISATYRNIPRRTRQKPELASAGRNRGGRVYGLIIAKNIRSISTIAQKHEK
jgi:hypothetical protein